MPLEFRKCSLDDLDRLVEISRKTFVDAFEKDNDPEDFKTYIDFAFDKKKLKDELENQESNFYFGYLREQVVGYFKLNQNNAQTDINASEAIELERIYVVEEFQRNRLGGQLLQEAIRLALSLRKDFLWLGVWEKNVDAIRFYQKHGFTKFGTHPYYIGKDKQTDWLMRYDLSTFQ